MCWKNSGCRFGKLRSSNQRMFVKSAPSQSSFILLMSEPAAVHVDIVKVAGPVCQAMCSSISATSACPLFNTKSSIPCSIWPIKPSAFSWLNARIRRLRGATDLWVTLWSRCQFCRHCNVLSQKNGNPLTLGERPRGDRLVLFSSE